MQCYPDTTFIGARTVAISKPPYIIDAQNLEYVVNAHACFHIGHIRRSFRTANLGETENGAVGSRITTMAQNPLNENTSLNFSRLNRGI